MFKKTAIISTLFLYRVVEVEKMNTVHENKSPDREHLISFLRGRLAENGMMITEESLEFTAERYAAAIMSNPSLNESILIDRDISKVKELLERINAPH